MRSFLHIRLPKPNDLRFVFLLLCVYSNTFAFIAFAKSADTLVNYFSLWDILGILAYSLMTALFEAGFVFAILIVLAAALPRKFYADRFVNRSVIWVLVAVAFLYPFVAPLSARGLDTFYTPLLEADSFGVVLATWGGVIVLLGFLLGFALSRPFIAKAFAGLVERLTVLGALFLVFDFLAIVLVLLRNIWPGA